MANVDEDLKRLAAEDLADAGPPRPEQDPTTIAEAIRAAAFCLREGGA